jgi:hypothetical protein
MKIYEARYNWKQHMAPLKMEDWQRNQPVEEKGYSRRNLFLLEVGTGCGLNSE